MALQLTSQWAIGRLYAAYRPIVVNIADDITTGPLTAEALYVDVYFNNILFRTITVTAWRLDLIVQSFPNFGFLPVRLFSFDLARTAQDYLKSNPREVDYLMQADSGGMNRMSCKIRTGRLQPSGLILEGTAIELTLSDALIVNAGVPHTSPEYFQDHLLGLQEMYYPGAATGLLPLTQRPNYDYTLSKSQLDHFPFIADWNGLNGGNNMQMMGLELQFHPNAAGGGGGLQTLTTTTQVAVYPFMVNYLPCGIPQLVALGFTFLNFVFASGVAVLDLIQDYRVRITDSTGFRMMSTNWITLKPDCEDDVPIKFLNRLGGYDTVNFQEVEGIQTTKSSSYETPMLAIPFRKRGRGRQRFNVRTTRKLNLVSYKYSESSVDWLSEMADSPDAYIVLREDQLNRGFPQNGIQPADLLPVVVQDGEVTYQKVEGRYDYFFPATVQLANDTPRQNQ